MAFGPVNTGGGASGRTLETIYKSIAEVRREAAEAMNAHTGADNPHGITTEDIDAVPTSRKINGKALSTDISLTAEDVGAAASGHSHSFENLSGRVFHAGTSAPSNKGLLWIDTTASTGGLKYHNGSAWVHVPVSST